jgi:PAS domain S-box-containing protein
MSKILLIDDSPDNLKSLNAILKDLFPDAEILTALTGKDGIELAFAYDPDVIVSDVIMPEMDGFEVCRRLKLDPKLRYIPVVFLTAFNESKENRLKAIDTGVEAFLHKPIDEAELFVQLKAMLKIKASNMVRLEEFSRLEELVHIRTEALEKELLEKERLNQQLIESEERFRSVFDFSNVGKSITKPTGEIFVNQAFCRMIGYTSEELSAKKWQDLTPVEDIDQCQGLLNQLLNGEREAFRFEKRYIHKNGSYIWADTNVAIKRDRSKVPKYFITTILDISDRKETERRLVENEVIFSKFMEHSPVFVFFKDDQIRSLRLSRNYEEMLGKKLEELLGKNMNELFPSELAREMVKIDQQILEKGEMIQVEEVFNGHYYTTIKFPIQVDGKHRYLAGFTIDITERKAAEEALKRSEARLIELNATKDKFFSIISHDLKSPFNSLMGFSNLLVEQVEQNDFQGIEEYARIIQLSSRRVMDLLENLLQWSRSQTGRLEFSPEFIELGQVVKEVTELMYDMAVQKTIQINNNTPPKTVVYADKHMMETILRNLISNAIKFTHPGGTIQINAEIRKGDLQVSVADTGVGIPKEQISKLFRIEESYSTPGTLKEHGTGLGLILCKDFVEKHGGRIWAESASNGQMYQGGSTFKFTIPIHSL